MVRVGPWTVTDKLRVHPRESCQRCGTKIVEVWCCEVDPIPERLAALGGQRSWRVGNECGPQLVEVTAEVWKRATQKPSARMRLLVRLDRLIAAAAARSYELPGFLVARRPSLIDGTLDARLLRQTGAVLGLYERTLRQA